MKLSATLVCLVMLACLHSTWSYRWHNPNKQRYPGRAGKFPNSSLSKPTGQIPKSQPSPRTGGMRPFRTRTGNPSFSFENSTCKDIQCPSNSECRMTDRNCQGTPCQIPLCFFAPPSLASTADNPGECPMTAVDGRCIDSLQFCTNDSVCALNQKCCLVTCDMACTNVTTMALARQMALFPRRSAMSRAGVRSRTSGRQAMFCPQVPLGAMTDGCGDMTCTSDNDCMGNKKCCAVDCGKICMNPVSILTLSQRQQTKAAMAFRARMAARANATASDNTTASAPSPPRPGSCPTIAVDANLTGIASCMKDLECPGSMKCCVYGQGLGCFNSINRPLPSALMSTRLAARRAGFNEHNVLRMRAMCPNVNPQTALTCGTACTEDSNCTSSQLCCDIGSCKECVNPVISPSFANRNPGICPMLPDNFSSICQVDCQDDRECDEGMRCCNYGCNSRCLNPVADTAPSIKAGSCPAPESLPGAFKRPSGAQRVGSPIHYRGKRRSLRTREEVRDGRKDAMATTTPGQAGTKSLQRAVGKKPGAMNKKAGSRPSAQNPDCAFPMFGFGCRFDDSCPGVRKCCMDSCGRKRCTMPV